ncbi:MAG TPA: hypothetical protein VGG89_05280 [Candidatus Baltobacteraceae bacterium]|jgi:uncharacterized membrane protein
MSVSQPPSDTPFGLQPNVAAGLAYLFGIIGGIVMLVGGGTNTFVKWAAAQSITLWGVYIVLEFALIFLTGIVHILGLILPLIGLLWFVLWLWTMITAFQGKEVRVPVIADLTTNIFKTAPAT